MAETLDSLVYKALTKVQDNPKDSVFSKEMTDALETYLESATSTTTEVGTISAGAYTGTGTLSSVKGDTSSCESTLLSCCTSLQSMQEGGNDFLAKQMALSIYLLGFNGEFTYNSSGTAVQGSSSTPMSGTSKGNLTINKSSLESSLKSFFDSFNALSDETIEQYNQRLEIGTTYKDNDDSFSHKFAYIVKPILESGQVLTKGEASLSGSIGTGTLTF